MTSNITEAWLKARGLSWKYLASVPLEKVRVTQHIIEQIRIDKKIDDDHVATYKRSYLQGDPVPPIAICEINSQYEVLDGLHRLKSAAAAGMKTIEAYLVDVDSMETVEIIRRTINLMNGRPSPTNERLLHASRMVSLGWTVKRAALEFRLSDGQLSSHLRADKQIDRLVELSAGRLSAEKVGILPGTVLGKMHSIKRPELALEVVDVARRAKPKLTADLLDAMVKEASDTVTDAAVASLKQRWASEYPEQPKRAMGDGVTRLPAEPAVIHQHRQMAQRYLTNLEKLVAQPRLSRDERVKINKITDDVIERAKKLHNDNQQKIKHPHTTSAGSFRRAKLRPGSATGSRRRQSASAHTA